MTTMNIPALRGKQGTRPFYVAVLTLKEIPRMFTFWEQGELDPEDRAQRTLSRSWIPELTGYLLEHENDWVLPSLTASFDAEEVFRAASPKQNPNQGVLQVPFDTDFFINDGQHRRAAI
jgi:DNA sulfur modification protein DndB